MGRGGLRGSEGSTMCSLSCGSISEERLGVEREGEYTDERMEDEKGWKHCSTTGLANTICLSPSMVNPSWSGVLNSFSIIWYICANTSSSCAAIVENAIEEDEEGEEGKEGM
jgi:hypothetical protein